MSKKCQNFKIVKKTFFWWHIFGSEQGFSSSNWLHTWSNESSEIAFKMCLAVSEIVEIIYQKNWLKVPKPRSSAGTPKLSRRPAQESKMKESASHHMLLKIQSRIALQFSEIRSPFYLITKAHKPRYQRCPKTPKMSFRARLQLRRRSGNFYFKIGRFLLKIIDF